MFSANQKYIIEVRDENGKLDVKNEPKKKEEHPYLFSKDTYTIDDLCYYMSFGQGRNQPSGPSELETFMQDIGISFRQKTW